MRLIDADKLRLSYWVSPTSTVSTAGQYYFYSQDEVDNAPTIDAEPVRHGKWIYEPKDAIEMMHTKPKCSVCGYESADGLHYCSNCGAKMDEEENDETEKWNVFESTDDRIYEVIKQIRHQLDEEDEEQE